MDKSPLVSVVMPTYNREAYLREAVESVFAQTYGHWELVVVDDGSTDGTAHYLEGLADERVRPVRIEHTGNLGVVRNRSLAEARGEFVAFMDSDDLFEPRKLELQVAALMGEPDAGWSYTALTRIDARGDELPETEPPFRALSGWILDQVLRFEARVDTPTVMVRRALMDRVGPLHEDLPESQDYHLFFRFAAASPAVALAEPLTRKRIHAGALSRDRTRVNEGWVQVYERFGATAVDPAVRWTCARLAQEHRLGAASWRARAGEPGRALGHVLAALLRRPWWLRAWRALIGEVLVRGFVGRQRGSVQVGDGPG